MVSEQHRVQFDSDVQNKAEPRRRQNSRSCRDPRPLTGSLNNHCRLSTSQQHEDTHINMETHFHTAPGLCPCTELRSDLETVFREDGVLFDDVLLVLHQTVSATTLLSQGVTAD